MTYQNAWFHDRTAIAAPPPEAVSDCSGQGRADTNDIRESGDSLLYLMR